MAVLQLPTNQEDREVYLREHHAGTFIDAVGHAQREADTLIMSLGAFAGEPENLYVALDYAFRAGVTVTMAPPADPADPA